MSRAGRTRSTGIPPWWNSLLAVTAHPEDVPFGLGAVLDAFIFADVRVLVLCLTHGQAWELKAAPGDLAALRGAELASAGDVLGATRAQLRSSPDGLLSESSQTTLASEIGAAAQAFHPDGLLVFDTAGLIGHLDHLAATSVVLRAAETLDLPVLGWSLSKTVALQLDQGFGHSLTGRQDEGIDLRVTFERARQRLTSREDAAPAVPGSARWRRLELLADTESLRWLRQPTDVGEPGPLTA